MVILCCIPPWTTRDCACHPVGSNCCILKDCCGWAPRDANFATVHCVCNSGLHMTVNMHIKHTSPIWLPTTLSNANACKVSYFQVFQAVYSCKQTRGSLQTMGITSMTFALCNQECNILTFEVMQKQYTVYHFHIGLHFCDVL